MHPSSSPPKRRTGTPQFVSLGGRAKRRCRLRRTYTGSRGVGIVSLHRHERERVSHTPASRSNPWPSVAISHERERMSHTPASKSNPWLIRGHQWPSVAIRGHLWPSVAIYGHPWPSVTIGRSVSTCMPRTVVMARGHSMAPADEKVLVAMPQQRVVVRHAVRDWAELPMCPVHLGSTHTLSLIRGHQRSSVAISGHQWPSEVTCRGHAEVMQRSCRGQASKPTLLTFSAHTVGMRSSAGATKERAPSHERAPPTYTSS